MQLSLIYQAALDCDFGGECEIADKVVVQGVLLVWVGTAGMICLVTGIRMTIVDERR